MRLVASTGRPVSDVVALGETSIVVQHDDAARAYDASNGALLKVFDTGPLGHFEASLAVHPNGRNLVVTTKSRVAMFDLDSEKPEAHIDVPSATGVVVTADGSRALFIGRLSGAEVALCEWTFVNAAPEELSQFGKYHNASGLLLTPDNRQVWVSLSTHMWRVDLETGATWESPRDERCLGRPVWIQDSNVVAIGTLDGCVQIWGGDDPEKQADVRVGYNALHKVCLAPVGHGLIAASSADQRINVLAPGDTSPRHRIPDALSHISALARDGDKGLLVGCSDGTVWRANIADEDVASPSRKKTTFAMTNHREHISALAPVAPDRIVSADLDGALCLWDKNNDDAIAYRKAKTNRSGGYKFAIESIAVVGDHLVVREGSSGFVVLEAATLKTVKKLPHKGASVAVTDGDKTLVTTGGKLLQSWSPESWELRQRREGLSAGTVGIAWVEALGGLLCRDGRNAISLFSADDLQTRKARSFGDVANLQSVRSNTMGTHLVLGFRDTNGESRVRVWEVKSGNVVDIPGAPRTPFFIDDTIVVVAGDSLVWFGMDGIEAKRAALPTFVHEQHVRIESISGDFLLLLSQDKAALVDVQSGALIRMSDAICPRPTHAILNRGAVACATEGGRVRWLWT